jgi:hypothetical protein
VTPQERQELAEAVTAAMMSMIGPTGDMQRAIISAKVDGLIDARKRFLAAGWPEWLIHSALMSFIAGTAVPTILQAVDAE